jgi:pyruvate dehydrogenase E1 component alpha subunit
MREEHDPIEQVRARLLKGKLASEDDLKKVDADIRSIVVAAAEFAQADAEPDENELHTDVLLGA